jgi:DNA-binding MarR family transcriptional regulator
MAKSRRPALLPMVNQVQQTLDILFWTLNRVLDDDGITVLQWAFLQRAYLSSRGVVPFSAVMTATGQSKNNVRRAAAFLRESGLGEVIKNPDDHRARIFKLSRRGRAQTFRIEEKIDAKLRKLLGANPEQSKRANEFNWALWFASGFLPPGDLTDMAIYQANSLKDDTPLNLAPLPKRVRPLSDPEQIPF